MEEIKEEWRDVIGYEGYYQVSNTGMVRSVDRVVTRSGKPIVRHSHYLKPRLSKEGYNSASLSMGGEQKYVKVHRIVAQAFILNLENKPQVNHINGNQGDNRVENLEWVTQHENMRHAVETGLFDGTFRRVKRSDGVVFRSINEASRKTKCDDADIGKCCKGTRKTCGGYAWSYA